MKTCSKCREDKPLSEYHRHKRRDGSTYLYAQCKVCHRQYARAHYQANRETYKRRAATNFAKYLQETRVFIRSYLETHPCTDCAEADIVVLQFDHCKGEKTEEVSNLLRRGMPLRTIKAEIEKCEVVCANCHTRRTARQFGWWQIMPS